MFDKTTPFICWYVTFELVMPYKMCFRVPLKYFPMSTEGSMPEKVFQHDGGNSFMF